MFKIFDSAMVKKDINVQDIVFVYGYETLDLELLQSKWCKAQHNFRILNILLKKAD
jgi:hypothetical protein